MFQEQDDIGDALNDTAATFGCFLQEVQEIPNCDILCNQKIFSELDKKVPIGVTPEGLVYETEKMAEERNLDINSPYSHVLCQLTVLAQKLRIGVILFSGTAHQGIETCTYIVEDGNTRRPMIFFFEEDRRRVWIYERHSCTNVTVFYDRASTALAAARTVLAQMQDVRECESA